MLSFLRRPWLLFILILLCIAFIASLNGFRRIDSEGVWAGLTVAGIAFILFGIIGGRLLV